MSEFSLETLQRLGLAPKSPTNTGPNNKLDQADFLMLMTKQLAQQDPFEPTDNGEMIAQMAEFSTLEGMQTLTDSFGVLARTLSQSQSLQAASLVGKDVLVPTEFSELTAGGSIAGAVDLTSSAQSVTIDVVNASGATVQQIALQDTSAGLNNFAWDGLLADGNPAPAGVYEFRASTTGGGESQAAEVYLDAEVDSVTVNEEGRLLIDVIGLGTLEFEDIRRIG
ncbi:flagellar hook assembly protein FlgD [Rhabdochromatium marinum]|uniref:flagellar hook assembly protein FlgD n=1 Tax=Rhabdochromatium marinum TaxID=48729 RepID=UPI001907E871|nr:flagellar hook assembly protein FlgD [Rhabdochromatium marinum]MBK1647465.1 flagellar hook capping protein [Rhabdochromatium marinum]